MTARLLVGDVFDRLGEIPVGSVDLVLTSPPFLALRSYLPEGHPDKAKEIGSEPTPAAFIDVLLQLTAAWGRVLAPHGSIAVELGDTYSGAGGYGDPDSPNPAYGNGDRFEERWEGRTAKRFKRKDDGWPEAKSLACIPQLYQVALAYGINPLTGQPSPAGRWRVRTLKPWIRSNPPVGALGDKERPATSYVIVACRASDRWFDLDAVRTTPTKVNHDSRMYTDPASRNDGGEGVARYSSEHAAGAPPRDWWHHVDAVLDAELAQRAGKPSGWSPGPTRTGKETQGARGGNWSSFTGGTEEDRHLSIGAQGVHLRRALERAGILTTLEALDVSPKGYSGAHYAVWPPELVRLLIDEMCPRRVCITCGQPSRRITETTNALGYAVDHAAHRPDNERRTDMRSRGDAPRVADRRTLGWSDCGHNDWRPGRVLDPFAGSGTTLAVCTGMARDATGIDLDERNADLARERVGMFLEVDYTRKHTHDPA